MRKLCKMSDNEYVALDVLLQICFVMNYGLDDVIEIERHYVLLS